MRETPEDLRGLQDLLDASDASGGSHLRAIFDATHRMNASDVVDALDGIFEMHLAAVTSGGAPLVAPLDAIFFKGSIWFGLPGGSVRGRLVRRDPRVSTSYTKGSIGVVAHGTAREVGEHDAEYAQYDALRQELYVAEYGKGWIEWWQRQDRGFEGVIDARRMFAKR